jgi:hypothetical protein
LHYRRQQGIIEGRAWRSRNPKLIRIGGFKDEK